MAEFNRKNFEGAVNHFRKAVELFPSFRQAYANIGASYYHLGDKKTPILP
jgi:Flp pilus assembly protein TadD